MPLRDHFHSPVNTTPLDVSPVYPRGDDELSNIKGFAHVGTRK